MYHKEAVMWKYLTHPNIVPFLGVTTYRLWDHRPPQLISNLMPGGILPDYIKERPDADRLELVGTHPVASFLCPL